MWQEMYTNKARKTPHVRQSAREEQTFYEDLCCSRCNSLANIYI